MNKIAHLYVKKVNTAWELVNLASAAVNSRDYDQKQTKEYLERFNVLSTRFGRLRFALDREIDKAPVIIRTDEFAEECNAVAGKVIDCIRVQSAMFKDVLHYTETFTPDMSEDESKRFAVVNILIGYTNYKRELTDTYNDIKKKMVLPN